MNDIHYIPCLSISSHSITSFYQVVSNNSKKHHINRFNLQSVSNKDSFSVRSQKKIRNYINWFTEQSLYKISINKSKRIKKYYKLALLTLTLPYSQHYSDEVIKKQLLNQFFTEARTKWNLKNYIWRAEKQENGNIHFHIVIDIFINWKEARDTWNRICDKLNLVKLFSAKMKEKYELGFTATEEEIKRFGLYTLKRRYKEGKKTNWTNPNSVDIRSLYKINNIGAYLAKYLSKKTDNNKNNKVSGRNWYVSSNIKKYCKNLTVELNDKIENELNKILKNKNITIVKTDFIEVFNISIKDLLKNTFFLKNLVLNYIKNMSNFLNSC